MRADFTVSVWAPNFGTHCINDLLLKSEYFHNFSTGLKNFGYLDVLCLLANII